MGAEGDVATGLGGVQPAAREKPLPFAIDQRDDGDRHLEHARRQPREPVEALVGRLVEHVQVVQRREALLLPRMLGGGHGTVFRFIVLVHAPSFESVVLFGRTTSPPSFGDPRVRPCHGSGGGVRTRTSSSVQPIVSRKRAFAERRKAGSLHGEAGAPSVEGLAEQSADPRCRDERRTDRPAADRGIGCDRFDLRKTRIRFDREPKADVDRSAGRTRWRSGRVTRTPSPSRAPWRARRRRHRRGRRNVGACPRSRSRTSRRARSPRRCR